MTDQQKLIGDAGLSHPCDLDLLLFFSRHPTAIMSSEHLAAFTGYDLAQVAKSLDLLVNAGVLRRSLNPTHIGRLYKFTAAGIEWLPPLLHVASTPDGRRQVMRALRSEEFKRQKPPPRRETEGANHA